jgi:hypothetical protein
MRNTEKVRRSATPNLLIQFPLAELTLQLAVDPSKSRRSIPAKADGQSQQEPTVDPDNLDRWISEIPDQLWRIVENCKSYTTARIASMIEVRERFWTEPVEDVDPPDHHKLIKQYVMDGSTTGLGLR